MKSFQIKKTIVVLKNNIKNHVKLQIKIRTDDIQKMIKNLSAKKGSHKKIKKTGNALGFFS